MPNEIKDLQVLEVSLVDKAANKRKFLIYKDEDSIEETSVDDSIIKTDEGGTQIMGDQKKTEDVKKTEVPVDQTKKEEKPVEQITKENVKQMDVPEEVKKQLDQLFKANEELSKKLQKEMDEKKEKMFIAKAETLNNLPMQPAEFGIVLKRIADSVETADYEALETVLKAANEEISQSQLFKEVGSGASGFAGKGSYSKIEKIAKALREADPKLSEAQAVEKALESNPHLYNEYLAETNQ